MTETHTAASIRFGHACPIFRVANLEASIAYFVRSLGFAVDWEYEGSIASVSRGDSCLFLCVGDQGHPGTWAWIGVGDATALHAEYLASGARVRQAPTNFEWSLEMQVEDLDGNVMRFGSGPLKDQPVGEWLDMHGRRWRKRADAGWDRAEGPDATAAGRP